MKFSAQQIADFLGGVVEGDSKVNVFDFSKIEEAKPGTVTFLANKKYTNYVYETEASIILVSDDIVFEKEVKTTLVRVADAYEALAKLMQLHESAKPKQKGKSKKASISKSAKLGVDCFIGDFAYIAPRVTVGKNVKIHPHAYIGEGVEIGDNTVIYPHVTIYRDCKIGAGCVLHSGSVIGADGFGFAPSTTNNYEKIPQIGIVILEDEVEVGANTTIDRATMGHTIIRKGVKLDNLVQVAHNVEIGENTVIAAQAGISGSSKLGANMMVGGQVGFAGHLTIANGVKIGAQSGVNNDIKEEEATLMGYPVTDMSTWRRSSIAMKNLPEMQRTIMRLEREIKALKDKMAK